MKTIVATLILVAAVQAEPAHAIYIYAGCGDPNVITQCEECEGHSECICNPFSSHCQARRVCQPYRDGFSSGIHQVYYQEIPCYVGYKCVNYEGDYLGVCFSAPYDVCTELNSTIDGPTVKDYTAFDPC